MIRPFAEPIYVTRPFLPPLADYAAGLREIWDNRWLTNHGPVHQRFEAALGLRLGTPNVALLANGTLALQIALQGLGLTGEVITTPFSFAATTHALYQQKLQPVFVDIEPETYTLDPERIEAAITPATSAILAVHVYGYPCRLTALADLARRHSLKLIYDAAHAFGVTIDGRSIGHFGDVSMFSLHATKVLHSVEGGLLMCADAGRKRTFDLLKDFGIASESEVVLPGTNAKLNELEALMGLLVLEQLDEVIARRRRVDECYRQGLAGMAGLRLPPLPPENVQFNFGYFPIEVDAALSGLSPDSLAARLREFNVHTRRYFHPLIPDYACYLGTPPRHPLPVARRVADRILCLPIYDSLELDDVRRICEMIRRLAPHA